MAHSLLPLLARMVEHCGRNRSSTKRQCCSSSFPCLVRARLAWGGQTRSVDCCPGPLPRLHQKLIKFTERCWDLEVTPGVKICFQWNKERNRGWQNPFNVTWLLTEFWSKEQLVIRSNLRSNSGVSPGANSVRPVLELSVIELSVGCQSTRWSVLDKKLLVTAQPLMWFVFKCKACSSAQFTKFSRPSSRQRCRLKYTSCLLLAWWWMKSPDRKSNGVNQAGKRSYTLMLCLYLYNYTLRNDVSINSPLFFWV